MNKKRRPLFTLRSRFSPAKRGQTLAEYSLVLAFISLVGISSLLAMGASVKGTFTTLNSQISTGSTSSGGSGSGSSNHGN